MMAALLVVLTACGGTAPSNNENSASNNTGAAVSEGDKNVEPADKKVTIVFQHIDTDLTTPRGKMTVQLIKNFMAENPNITVEQDAIQVDQQRIKIKTQAASNELPDVTTVFPGPQIKPFIDADLLAPLDDLLPDMQDLFMPGVTDFYSLDGKPYAFPVQNNIALFYYNKKMFADAGVEPPKTFDELVQVGKTLKAKGITPMAIGEKDAWTGSLLLIDLLLRVHGPGFLEDIKAGKAKFTDPDFVTAIDKLKQMVQADMFEEGATSIDNSTARNLFKQGKTAMMHLMSQYATEFSEALGEDLGVFRTPTVDGKGNANDFLLIPGQALAVAKNGENVDAAKKFVQYYVTNYAKTAVEHKNPLGLAVKVDADLKSEGFSPLLIEVGEMFSNLEGGSQTFDNAIDPAPTQTHFSLLQKVFVQKVDPMEIAQAHQDALDKNTTK
jgi:raffinose/stachyose/melibiose transport system substrate-binding protein